MTPRERLRGAVTAVGLGAIVVVLAGCGAGSAAPAPKATPSASPATAPAYLDVQPATRDVALLVIAGQRTGGFDLNGTENGAMRFVVPVGWRVAVTLRNRSTLRNSLAVVAAAGSRTPVFAGAGAPLRALGYGIGQAEQAVFRFRATRVGTYRLASLVSGHEASGMWAALVVVRGGRPSLSLGQVHRTQGGRP